MTFSEFIEKAGWKVSLFLAGLVVAGLTFWFFGGQSMMTVVNLSAQTLSEVQHRQENDEDQLRSLANSISTLAQTVAVENQRLSDDEARHNFNSEKGY